jgi:hypothetical protein
MKKMTVHCATMAKAYLASSPAQHKGWQSIVKQGWQRTHGAGVAQPIPTRASSEFGGGRGLEQDGTMGDGFGVAGRVEAQQSGGGEHP